ncbi:MAG: hypothetical protein FJ030_08570 [Chloroflexi bacterium]|nr:hypothetical protein [Chloroflexota bacterium]
MNEDITKRGPKTNRRYCFRCARPSGFSNVEWLFAEEVTVNGQRAFKMRTRASRPVVCDRCGQQVNNFYEVRPDRPPLRVEVLEAREQEQYIALTIGVACGCVFGMFIAVFLWEGFLRLLKDFMQFFPFFQ